MEEKFSPVEFAEFYYHDIDGNGLPYDCPVNPVHTVFALEGSDEAIRAASTLITDIKNENFDGITIKNVLGYRVFDIEINNFIADLYDKLVAIPGMEEVLYFIYDKAYERLITNDRNRRLLAVLNLPDYEPETDDEDMFFPEPTELSLPTGEE